MPSHFLSFACHLRFLASFVFANKHFILGIMRRYHTTLTNKHCIIHGGPHIFFGYGNT